MERKWTTSDDWQALVLNVLDWIRLSPVYFELYTATETGNRFHWSVQIVGNASAGILLFLLAWLLFGFVAKEPEIDVTTRGMVARSTSRRWRLFSAGPAWSAALVWKDFFFIAGGWAGIVVRCLLYGGLFGLCYAANTPWYLNSGIPLLWQEVTHGFQLFAHPLLALDAARSASRVFQEEIRGQTLPALLMLPRSITSVVYSKVCGCGLAMLPGGGTLFCSLFLPGGMDFLTELTRQPGVWWWMMHLILLIHLAAVFSIFLRTGAFVLAMGAVIGSIVLTSLIYSMISLSSRGSEGSEDLMTAWTVGLGLVCASCHAIIVMKMPSLGEK